MRENINKKEGEKYVTLVGEGNTNRINFSACDRFKSISMRATAKHKSLLD